MKLLPLTLRSDGFDLEQVTRDANFAVYKQKKDDLSTAYEVIRIEKHKAAKFKRFDRQRNEEVEITVEEGEGYPRTESWGTWGWTFRTLDEAMARFSELQEQARKESE